MQPKRSNSKERWFWFDNRSPDEKTDFHEMGADPDDLRAYPSAYAKWDDEKVMWKWYITADGASWYFTEKLDELRRNMPSAIPDRMFEVEVREIHTRMVQVRAWHPKDAVNRVGENSPTIVDEGGSKFLERRASTCWAVNEVKVL